MRAHFSNMEGFGWKWGQTSLRWKQISSQVYLFFVESLNTSQSLCWSSPSMLRSGASLLLPQVAVTLHPEIILLHPGCAAFGRPHFLLLLPAPALLFRQSQHVYRHLSNMEEDTVSWPVMWCRAGQTSMFSSDLFYLIKLWLFTPKKGRNKSGLQVCN